MLRSPLGRAIERVRAADPQLLIFLGAIACVGATAGVFHSTINNFLSDTFDMGPQTRGRLEFPRELPGFLAAAFWAGLFFLSASRLGAVASAGVAAGMLGLGLVGRHYSPMIAALMIWSAGSHLAQPASSTLALQLARAGERGRRLGQVGATRRLATILGCAVVWIVTEHWPGAYSAVFIAGAAFALAGSAVYLRMRSEPVDRTRQRPLVFRRRYGLYYLLSVLFGARKQVFLTFGPWVLVRIFQQPASTLAKLGMINAVIGVLLQPQIGKLIDRVGERIILVGEGLALILVCLGYGYGDRLPLGDWTLYLICLCYVCDELLFSVGMARTTYLDKIALKREDVTPSLALSVTLDHAVSMSIPTLGGYVWARFSAAAVFLGAAGLAFIYACAACFVRTPPAEARPTATAITPQVPK